MKKPCLTLEDIRKMEFDPPLTELECFIGISARGRRERERKALQEEQNSRGNPSSTPPLDTQSVEENLVLARRDQELLDERDETFQRVSASGGGVDISKGERLMGEKTLKHPVGITMGNKKKKQGVLARDVTEDDITDFNPCSSKFDDLVHVSTKARKLYKEAAKNLKMSQEEEPLNEEFHCPTPEAAAKRKRMLMREKNLKKPLVIENPKRVEREEFEGDEEEEEGDAKVVKKKNKTDNYKEVTVRVLPKEILDKIRRQNGSEAKLVIQKKLFPTDLDASQNRLSMPLNQLENVAFLTEDEYEFVRGRAADGRTRNGIPVLFIEPNGDENLDLMFKWWDMPKVSGKNKCSIYIFNGKWHDVSQKHKLDKGLIVQVWSFRYTRDNCQRKLGFAMVIVGRDKNGNRNRNRNRNGNVIRNGNQNGNRNANGNGKHKHNGSSGGRSETSGSQSCE
ncbi:hypothetical protein Vadar_008941 [Vaccinium darrowii]|uniref:Uncharacterized protein n=1 Tax=Vaccinium darrowii TaxID=229202 RepID=A0ACB7Z557_9ERIC|nr:hypothetical protein Vadar_008941 [Vaccinium darrowii]